MSLHRPHRIHPHRPTDRHLGELAVYLVALAVMALAVLLQVGGTR